MNATGFYLTTCRYVMAADFTDPQSWADLDRYLPYLRQSLSCFVCRNLVLKPIAPRHKNCFHFVCEKCKGGRMRLKPQCSWCKNYNDFEENIQLRVLVLCFQKLCEYIYYSPIGEQLSTSTTNGETNTLVTMIQEGCQFKDDFQVTSPLLPPALSSFKTTKISSSPSKLKDSQSSSSSSFYSPTFKHQEENGSNVPSHENILTDDNVSQSSTDEEDIINITVEKKIDSSPVSSDEIIDVCKTPSPIEKDKNHKKRRPILSFDKSKDASLLEQKVLMFNCVDSKDINTISSPVIELAVKKAKVVVTSPKVSEIKICKCGRGGTNSRLTCLGQRCPCYIKKLPCIGCKCTGCRNPRKAADQKFGSNSLIGNQSGVQDKNESEKLCIETMN